MRIFLTVLILTFSLQSLTKADDIRDFQIEGMSIGDSLLDFFSDKTINKALDESHKGRLFITKTIKLKDSDIYEHVQVSYRRSDKNKKLHSVVGVKVFPDNIKRCRKEMKKIDSEFSLLFNFAIKKDWGKYNASQGHYFPITFDFKDKSRAMIACYDWNKESGIKDNLKITLYSAEYREYLQTQLQ
tara:strand:+ start:1001 stop:1558 length:558 start_codon:yes stop_codon:yes gene_type:complete